MTILRRIAYLRLAELWSLPHLSGEASPTSPIGSLWSHGVTRTANTPQVGVHRFTKRWSLPHLTGEASPTSPIGPLWSHGVTRTANTPQGRVRSFCVHVFAVSRGQRSWRCLFGFSAVVWPLAGSCRRVRRLDRRAWPSSLMWGRVDAAPLGAAGIDGDRST